jgi:hypothetical protein
MLRLGNSNKINSLSKPSSGLGKWQSFRCGFSDHLLNTAIGISDSNLKYKNKSCFILKGAEYDITNGHETEPNLNLNFSTDKWLSMAIWTRFHGASEIYDEPGGPSFAEDQFQVLVNLNGGLLSGGTGEPVVSMGFSLAANNDPPKLGVKVTNFNHTSSMAHALPTHWETPDDEWTLNFVQVQFKDPSNSNTNFDIGQVRSNPSNGNDADYTLMAYSSGLGVTEAQFPGYATLGDNQISPTENEVGLSLAGDVHFDSNSNEGASLNTYTTLRESEWNNFTMWVSDDRLTESQFKQIFQQGPGCIGRTTYKDELQVCNISAESLYRTNGDGPTDVKNNFIKSRLAWYPPLEDRFTYANRTLGLGSALTEWSFNKLGNYTGS